MEEYRKQHPDSIASVIARNRQQSGVKRPASKPLSSDQGAEMTSTYVLPFQVFYEEQVEAFKATLDVPHTELDMKLKLLERWNALMPEDKLSKFSI